MVLEKDGKISLTDHVRNVKVLLRIKEQRNIYKLPSTTCYKGKIEVTGRRGRRCRKLLDDLKERRGYSHSKEEALDCTVWRARFGRGFGPVV